MQKELARELRFIRLWVGATLKVILILAGIALFLWVLFSPVYLAMWLFSVLF